MPTDTSASGTFVLSGRVLPLADRVHIMGVLNVTPDSFSDGGRYVNLDAAVAHAFSMVEQGADVLDIGAESTKPGAVPIDEEEERRRLIPIVRAICRQTTVPVSVDTTKASIARQALDVGAALINDISALRFDARMGDVVAKSSAGLILMHMQGNPQTMQDAAQYTNVVEEVRQFLKTRLDAAEEAGIHPNRILLDPGIGFGKNCQHNLVLLERLRAFHALGRPLVVGVSRKAFIGKILGRPIEERLMGTAGAVAVAVMNGARMVRVHDVAPIRDVIKMIEAIREHRQSAGADTER
ncbi:dihydropteroate synthase [Nitrospira sp. Nam74]